MKTVGLTVEEKKPKQSDKSKKTENNSEPKSKE